MIFTIVGGFGKFRDNLMGLEYRSLRYLRQDLYDEEVVIIEGPHGRKQVVKKWIQKSWRKFNYAELGVKLFNR